MQCKVIHRMWCELSTLLTSLLFVLPPAPTATTPPCTLRSVFSNQTLPPTPSLCAQCLCQVSASDTYDLWLLCTLICAAPSTHLSKTTPPCTLRSVFSNQTLPPTPSLCAQCLCQVSASDTYDLWLLCTLICDAPSTHPKCNDSCEPFPVSFFLPTSAPHSLLTCTMSMPSLSVGHL